MTPWVESSGYNATLTRRTSFSGYTATNGSGTWSPVWTCNPSSDNDNHQTMRMSASAGNISWEHRADGAVECINGATSPVAATPAPGPGSRPTATPRPRSTPTATSTPRATATGRATATPTARARATATPTSGGTTTWQPNVFYAVGATV